MTWNQAYIEYGLPKIQHEAYRDGFRSGWLDASVGHRSLYAVNSFLDTSNKYAVAYGQGYRDAQEAHKGVQ